MFDRLRRLRDAQFYSDGAWGHGTVTLDDGTEHRVLIEGSNSHLAVTTIDGIHIPIPRIIEVAYEDVNGH